MMILGGNQDLGQTLLQALRINVVCCGSYTFCQKQSQKWPLDPQTLLSVLWSCLQGLYPCDDFGVVSSLNKDNNGGDQVEDGCYKASEEIL